MEAHEPPIRKLGERESAKTSTDISRLVSKTAMRIRTFLGVFPEDRMAISAAWKPPGLGGQSMAAGGELLTRLQDELEDSLLEALGAFIKRHPKADSARFAVTTFLSLAGRIGLSHLDPDSTAKLMETVTATVRDHGARKKGIH